MIRGKENLISWARFANSIYWTVKNDKGQTVGSRDGKAPADLEMGLTELETLLGFLDPGKYSFDGVYEVSEATAKKHVQDQFLIVSDDPKQAAAQQQQQPVSGLYGVYGTPDKIEEMIDRRATQIAEKIRFETKIERLEDEVKRLTGEKPMSRSDQAWATVIETVGPQLPAIISGLAATLNQSPNTPVAGAKKQPPQNQKPRQEPNPATEIEIEEEEAHKIQNAIATLYQWDNNTPDILAKLAYIAENNPDKLNQLLPVLDQFAT